MNARPGIILRDGTITIIWYKVHCIDDNSNNIGVRERFRYELPHGEYISEADYTIYLQEVTEFSITNGCGLGSMCGELSMNSFYENNWKYVGVIIPLWCLILIIILPFFFSLIRTGISRSRKRRGHCVNCGYNLYGITHTACPECGTEFDPELLKKLQEAQRKRD